MAVEAHIEALIHGPRAWNEFRREHKIIKPDFRGAQLAGFDLSEDIPGDFDGRKTSDFGARGTQTINIHDLMHPEYFIKPALDFRDDPNNFADLSSADFSGANLNNSYLGYSNLSNALFVGAKLHGARFDNTNALGADFSKANLAEASFEGALLENACFHSTHFSATDFLDTDLRGVEKLESANHTSSSTIDLATLGRSGTLPAVFLRGCGLPDKLIEALALLVDESDQYYSCFISYSHEDKDFATKLHSSLQKRGIRCWLDVHQMLPGDDIYEQVDKGIRLWDKVLLCCSSSSLTSWWVDNELDTAFEKERNLMSQRKHKTYVLVPLDLDGYMFSDVWVSGKKRELRSRIAANFCDWKKSDTLDKDELERIVRALRVGEITRTTPPESKL